MGGYLLRHLSTVIILETQEHVCSDMYVFEKVLYFHYMFVKCIYSILRIGFKNL